MLAWQYSIKTFYLALGVDTIVEIYNHDGLTQLASDDDSGDGLASKLDWIAPSSGTYFIRIHQNSGSTIGCEATYQMSVIGESYTYLPIINK